MTGAFNHALFREIFEEAYATGRSGSPMSAFADDGLGDSFAEEAAPGLLSAGSDFLALDRDFTPAQMNRVTRRKEWE